ncbi:MAG: MtrB/PioB family decaheme-associated outer membrane protein [Alcanivoracaceae bacterium]|nr:MtrB/PioB family decaheme-associated outer membrane protein [Alcanivoracaceae bacterium]
MKTFKNIQKSTFNKFILLSIVLAGLSSIASANDTDFSKWKCKLCPDYSGWTGDVAFGLGFVSEDDLRFADFRGQDEQGLYLAIDGRAHYQDADGYYFNLNSHNLGLDSRQLEINGGHQGKYEYRFGWSEISKYRGYGSQTPFLGAGTDNLTLPTDWVPAVSTDQMTQLGGLLLNTSLKTHRKILDAGVTWKFAQNWEYRFDYQKQKKNGTRPFAAGLFFNNASQFPVPVDFTTDQIDMVLSWLGKRSQVRIGLIGSWFDNANNSVTWQNPFTSGANTQTLRAALEPDNKYYQLSVSGAFALSPKVKLSGSASIGEMSQDDQFIPYSINPLFSDAQLPRTSLDAQVDTSTFNLSGKLSARLNRKLTFTARVKFDERDNKTPVDLYTPVTTDLVPSAGRLNRPYSYDKEKYSADLRFRAHRVVKLSTGVKFENLDRTLQAVEESEETTLWGEIKLNPNAQVQGRIKFEDSKRDISDYLQPDDGGSVDHPLLRKFNQADRDRERLQVEINIYPIEALGINLSFFHARDDYEESQIGLQKSDEESYTIDLSYAVGTKINLYAFLTEDDIDAELVNATGVNAIPWNAITKDSITTAGLGLSTNLNKKVSLGLDFVSSNSKGDISVQTDQNEAPFSPLRTNLKNARIHFDYQVNDHWGYKLYTEYEKYYSKDWAIDGVGVDGIGSVLTLGTQSPNYSAWIFRLQANYRF